MEKSAICVWTSGLGLVLSLSGVVLAQVESTDSPTPTTADAARLEEIVVTGTHIRGAEAAGSHVIVISRAQIDASGYGRIEDVLSTVTQNFNRINAATAYSGFDNLNRGTEVQLRGLGGGTTLTLVNGQRQAASGEQGLFTDVSSIPASAVERIEVLPEAAAALYGSDAIGGVVNIVLRRDFTGLEARARASTAGGDARERTIAMLWGQAGSGGHLLAGFQVDNSEALACGARDYCAANGDYRGFGGSDLRGVGGNPGTILDPVTLAPVAAIPHGQDGTHLTPAELIPGAVNYTNMVLDNDIVPKQTMRSAFASASLRITDQWEWSADGRYSSRKFKLQYPQGTVPLSVPANNAFNHLGGPVLVAYDLTPDLGPVIDSGPEETFFVGTGIKGTMRGGWQLDLTGSYTKARTEFVEANTLNSDAIDAALNSADPATALNIFGDGSHTNPVVLANLRSQNATGSYLDVFTTTAASVIADGPLMTEAAGTIRAAVGADYRKEHSVGFNIAGGPENRGRQVYAGFFELAVPLMAAGAESIAKRLELSLAGRYDRYSDAGSTFNPTLGLSARPLPQVRLRGTWGTAFRAPPFFYSDPDQVGDVAIDDVVDPRSPSGYSRALLLFGPKPDLKPETARSWTLGVDLTPPVAQNFSLSLTYFDIDYRGKITHPGPLAAAFLTQEVQFASVITRNPTQAQIDAVCKKPPLYGGACNQSIAVILDNGPRNLASVKTRGMDIALDFSRDTTKGKWVYGLNGTYTFDQQQQLTPTAQVFDYVDTVGNPLRVRFAGHLSWLLRRWTVQATVNYTGWYKDPGSVPARSVDSWTTADVNIGYQVGSGHGWLANSQVNFGVINLLDQRPPFVNQFDNHTGTLGYDPANATVLGRQLSLQIVKGWGK